jgi:hypothetical protein
MIFSAGNIVMLDFPGFIGIKSRPDAITNSIGLQ